MTPGYDNSRRTSGTAEDAIGAIVLVACVVVMSCWYLAVSRFGFTNSECLAILLEAAGLIVGTILVVAEIVGRRAKRGAQWPHPPIFVPTRKDAAILGNAHAQGATVLGYNVHGEPWLWPDNIRTRHGILAGGTGAGKTTFLENILTQDLHRRFNGRPMPIIIFDGKGDQEFLDRMLPHIEAAGRLQDFRLLDPIHPDCSARYNPFYATENDLYQDHVNFIFQSFGLHKDFFEAHQEAYLYDLVRTLHYTGKRFNTNDVLVMALDEKVLAEQIKVATERIARLPGTSVQARLNFEMSARMLKQSFKDRERIPKIQGLINELVAFLEDNLSIITNSYHDLLTVDEIVDKGLILWVPLNTAKNERACEAFGKILLQNIQLMIGKRYGMSHADRGSNEPYLSVLFDEIGPFLFPKFTRILQTGRGARVMILFSFHSIPQMQALGQPFADEVTSAPATKIIMNGSEERTVQWFMNASSRVVTKRRTLAVRRSGFFSAKYRETGTGSESDVRENRVQEDHIKNLPVGQMQVLMADAWRGTLYSHLHARRQPSYRLNGLECKLYPRMHTMPDPGTGANLRFRDESDPRTRRRSSGFPFGRSLEDAS